ncbi:unnamed protein product [Adineta ricciae]|uniref:Ig-like domain-containing protein n=1 Tax=Adineta ricciae TaxID=249248 RepID=A0A814DK01_ADIRI|nr:unnamed protein product [Adineta ricciae]
MYIITSIITVAIVIPIVQLARPSINLTFTPDEKYMSRYAKVEIQCGQIQPNAQSEPLQLWYVDYKTGKRTPVSRTLLTAPTDDAPDVFRNHQNHRYEFVRKNHIRIRSLQMEDSARYECNCPDCEESIPKQTKDLYVMQLATPVWVIDLGGPLHENTKTTIKCQVDDFYPYVRHRILRDQTEITKDGKSDLSDSNSFPQKFVWQMTITPKADWHNSTLTCSVRQGNTERVATETLNVLFTPNFLDCSERQFVDPRKDQSSIECSYNGNPAPQLTWLRQSDQRLVTSDAGITIETKDESKGKYRSIVTFDRNKLTSLPLPPMKNGSVENYYQYLLNNGFLVKLTVNGNEKGTRAIKIVKDARQVQSKVSSSSTTTISLATMILLAFSLLFATLHR